MPKTYSLTVPDTAYSLLVSLSFSRPYYDVTDGDEDTQNSNDSSRTHKKRREEREANWE